MTDCLTAKSGVPHDKEMETFMGGHFPLIISLLRGKPSRRTFISFIYQYILQVRDYLLDECHVIYECRTCLNMFRSVANFIAHKRSYCTAKLKNVRHVYRRDPPEELDLEAESTTAFVEPEPVETVIPNQEWDLKDYSPSLELLREAGLIKELETRPLVTSLKKDKSLSNIIGKLRWKAQGGLEGDFYRSREREATTYLMEPMRQTTQAVFQVCQPVTDCCSIYITAHILSFRRLVMLQQQWVPDMWS